MTASSYVDVCRFTPTAGGTANFTFSAAVGGYQSPSAAGIVNGAQYSYRAESGDLTQWEVGQGTYNTSTGVFSRTTVLYNSSATGTGTGQSGAGTLINFTTAPQVAIVALGEDLGKFAPINSPALTGTPTSTTPSTGDSSTNIATTAFVANEAVRYDINSQGLTATQQTNARVNIYAAPFDALCANNIAVNGNMEVSQANGTSAVTTNGYVVDGWNVAAQGAALSAQQVTDAPPGYSASLKVSITTADASPAAGDYVQIIQSIEGYRVERLAFGTSSASSLSIGFWVKANRAGTYSGSLRNNGSTRSYPFSFTVASSATWQFITVTAPGDTSGTWAMGNGIGLRLTISMMCGTTYAGPVGAWASAIYVAATGTINGAAATSDYMQITGVVVLPGIELPSASRAPLIMRPYGQELQICKRYYETVGGRAIAWAGSPQNGSAYPASAVFSVTKRNVPTMTLTYVTAVGFPAAAPGTINPTISGFEVEAIANATAAYGYFIYTFIADARL